MTAAGRKIGITAVAVLAGLAIGLGFFYRQAGEWDLASRAGTDRPAENGWHEEKGLLYNAIPVRVDFFPEDEDLAKEVWAYLESVDGIFNKFKKGTELYSLNHSTDPSAFPLSGDMLSAFAAAFKAHRLSKGAFDITVEPLCSLWRDAATKGISPSKDELARERGRVGLLKVEVGDGRVRAPAGMRFDFGGIIKGLAVDRAVAMLKGKGVRAALVQVGGETAAFGISRRGRSHVVGVENPLDPGESLSAVEDQGTGLSVSTSANTYQPIVIGGREYYHIIDPRTGEPADASVLSVSIVFPCLGRNGEADGLSTAAVVLGPEAALPIISAAGAEALFLVKRGGKTERIESPGWSGLAAKQN